MIFRPLFLAVEYIQHLSMTVLTPILCLYLKRNKRAVIVLSFDENRPGSRPLWSPNQIDANGKHTSLIITPNTNLFKHSLQFATT